MSLNYQSSDNFSKIGLETPNIIDNNCGEFVAKKLFIKPKRILVYHTRNSILSFFPLYDLAEIDNNLENSSQFGSYFTKTFIPKLLNRPDLNKAVFKSSIDFEEDEFIQSLEVIYNNKESLNQGEINGLIINTTHRVFKIGKTTFDSEYIKRILKIKNQFILGFKTCFELNHNKEFDTKVPSLSFIKIYTEENSNQFKYYTPSYSARVKNKYKICTKIISLIFLIISFLLSYYYSSQNIYKGLLIINSSENELLKLDYPSKLHTDEHGFVHIKAETVDDAFFTLGIAHARDRLWQMDFVRRLARGRLCEVLGEKAFKIDKLMRNIGINNLANQDEVDLKQHSEIYRRISKYVEAINFYANSHYLPPEYQILQIKFENWTITDSLAYARFLTYSVTLDYPLELFNNLILNNLGQNFYEMLTNVSYENFLNSNMTVVSHEELTKYYPNLIKENLNHSKGAIFNSSIKIMRDGKAGEDINVRNVIPSDLVSTHASNSWVISGNLTSSGKPILANDPHLSNAIPSIHYIVKMYIGNLTDNQKIIVGSSPPGMPIFLVGSNRNLSWGITTDNRDVSDVCEEILDSDDISEAKFYNLGEKKSKLLEVEEVIKIKSGTEKKITIKYTKNGPLIENFIKELSVFGVDYKYQKKENSAPNFLSLRISPFKFRNPLIGQFSLGFAESKEELLKGFDTNYGGPLLAFSWATTDGEIGYTPIGNIPIKHNKESIFCKGYLDEENSSDNILGYIPRNETPVITNPDKGFIVTANNRQFPNSYIHYSQSYAYFNRFVRISDLISQKVKEQIKFDWTTSIEILSDVKDLYAESLLPKIINIIERNLNLLPDIKKDILLSYLDSLKNFDCNFYKNSTAATLYSVLEFYLGKNLILKNADNNVLLGFDTDQEARGILNNFNYWNFIYDFVDKIERNITVDLENCKFYKPFSNCEGYILDSFEKLDEFMLNDGYLKDSGNIKEWGEVHFQYYPHTFDQIPILKNIFSRKIPTDGNRYTIKVSKTKFHDLVNGPFTSSHSANLKFLSDLSDITRPYIVIDTGNSGNIFSKFYDNLIWKSENNQLIKIKHHEFNDDVHLLISFPEHNTLIIRNK